MERGIRAALFDFDMTLVDSSYAIHRCTNMLARHCGLREVTREEVLATIGLPIEGCWRALWGDYRDEWVDYYRANFRGEEQSGLRFFPNTLSALERLSAAGVKVGVASNRRFARKVTDAMGLTPRLEAIVGLECVERAKPEPDVLFKGFELLGVSPEDGIYVGDTDIDMKTAVAAKVRGVGMTTGNFDEAGLIAAGAWRVCADLSEVAELAGA